MTDQRLEVVFSKLCRINKETIDTIETIVIEAYNKVEKVKVTLEEVLNSLKRLVPRDLVNTLQKYSNNIVIYDYKS